MRTLLLLAAMVLIGSTVACALGQTRPATATAPEAPYTIGQLLFSDDFTHGLDRWAVELENGGKVDVANGALNIDTPAGCTVWFKSQLQSPVMIEYTATVIKADGVNDRVSDLNCFWMATDPRSPGDILARPRSGKFADYNELKCYYVGYGGNTNTTTRFRRYIGSPTTRPILPEHDLTDAKYMLKPNTSYKIQLVAMDKLIQYFRDGEKIFEYTDDQPYTHGWFAIRTTWNHMTVKDFKVYQLNPAPKP
jgi:hypothetical protein